MKNSNVFDGAADGLSQGIDALFSSTSAQFSMIDLDMIEVKAQHREVFEDEENTLADLAAHIKENGVLQPILLRPTDTGFELIAGERRYRASKLAGLDQIPAYIREMTDEQADDAQLAENIHRKALTQIEEAKKIQRDLDAAGGDIQAVLEKHKKSRAWLSKILSLLNLPEQATRLVNEGISADLEVINTVKGIEKTDPEAAKELVNDLAATRGTENARKKVEKVKDEVKPPKKPRKPKDSQPEEPAPVAPPSSVPVEPVLSESFDVVVAEEKPVDSGSTDAEENKERVPGLIAPDLTLDKAYFDIRDFKAAPKAVLASMDTETKESVDAYLYGFYEAGTKAKQIGRAVLQGFDHGTFSTKGAGAIALVAFLLGADVEGKFNLIDVLGSVKK